jgi:hypothetical protein
MTRTAFSEAFARCGAAPKSTGQTNNKTAILATRKT